MAFDPDVPIEGPASMWTCDECEEEVSDLFGTADGEWLCLDCSDRVIDEEDVEQ